MRVPRSRRVSNVKVFLARVSSKRFVSPYLTRGNYPRPGALLLFLTRDLPVYELSSLIVHCYHLRYFVDAVSFRYLVTSRMIFGGTLVAGAGVAWCRYPIDRVLCRQDCRVLTARSSAVSTKERKESTTLLSTVQRSFGAPCPGPLSRRVISPPLDCLVDEAEYQRALSRRFVRRDSLRVVVRRGGNGGSRGLAWRGAAGDAADERLCVRW